MSEDEAVEAMYGTLMKNEPVNFMLRFIVVYCFDTENGLCALTCTHINGVSCVCIHVPSVVLLAEHMVDLELGLPVTTASVKAALSQLPAAVWPEASTLQSLHRLLGLQSVPCRGAWFCFPTAVLRRAVCRAASECAACEWTKLPLCFNVSKLRKAKSCARLRSVAEFRACPGVRSVLTVQYWAEEVARLMPYVAEFNNVTPASGDEDTLRHYASLLQSSEAPVLQLEEVLLLELPSPEVQKPRCAAYMQEGSAGSEGPVNKKRRTVPK